MTLAAALAALSLSAGAASFEAPVSPLSASLPTASATPRLPVLPVLPALSAEIARPPELPAADLPVSALLQAQTALPRARASAAAPRSAEAQADDSAHAFDGVISRGAVSAAEPASLPGWSAGSLPSPVDANPIAYRVKAGSASKPARVYSGGLALQESFETYFASRKGPPGAQYFMWTRGHPPTPWKEVRSPLEADARDLARVIVKAGDSTKTGKVELALHSYGNLVFQRLIQLRGEPEIDRALELVSGARVFMLNATTHYDGSERRAGLEFEQMGMGARRFVDWLNLGDDVAEQWRAAAKLNPLLIPQANAMIGVWEAQRATALSLASSQASAMQKKDLEERWSAHDEIRRGLREAVGRDARDLGWQEALLRRSSDMFRLEFSRDDVKFLKKLGVRLELVHSAGDKLLNWESARALFERLGIEAPEKTPAPGAVLTDRTGRFRARIVAGDHYFPLKDPAALAVVLDR